METTKSIIFGDDWCNVCEIFYEYFKHLNDYIRESCPYTNNLSDADKSVVFENIYDHSMMYIYNEIYPKIPSTDDQFIDKQLNKFSKLSFDELKIDPEYQRVEFLEFAIKRIYL